MEEAGADGLHLDIMDGHFVPNITFGPVVIQSIRKLTRLPFWAHLMIEQPNRYLEAFLKTGVDGIIVHSEIEDDWLGAADRLHELGIGAGLAINPETPFESLVDFLDRFDRFLVMTVHPGFGGQSFMPGPLATITAIRRHTEAWAKHPVISVDGGIDTETAPRAVMAGADTLVAGSAIFRAKDPARALQDLRSVAENSEAIER